MSRLARAQAYPSRSVRIVVGFAPGGRTDIAARLIGQWLSARLGQQFVIENRPGAGSNIATEAVVRASADGYTLLSGQAATTQSARRSTRRLSFQLPSETSPGCRNYPRAKPHGGESDRVRPRPFRSSLTMPMPIRGKVYLMRLGRNGTAEHLSGRTVQDDDRCRHGSCAVSR